MNFMFRYRSEVEFSINSKTKEGTSIDEQVSQKVATIKTNTILFANCCFFFQSAMSKSEQKNYKTHTLDSKSRIRIFDNDFYQIYNQKTNKTKISFAVKTALKQASNEN